jgi:hypothetical protein
VIDDPYSAVPNPTYRGLLDETPATPELLAQHGITPTMPLTRNASELGPSLNVSLENSATYGGNGRVLISVRAGDVLDAGGRFYSDVGAQGAGVRPFIVTVPHPVPYRIESAP